MSQTIILTKIDEVYFRVSCDLSQSMELKEFFSCFVPNYQFSPKFKSRMWNGKVSSFDMKTKLLPIGLLPELYKFLQKFGYPIRYDFDKHELCNEIEEDELKSFYDVLFANVKDKFYPRDYQHDAILKALRSKRGVEESCTGSGKSLILYTITRFMLATSKQVLLIVPTTSLVEQMYSDFQEYGWNNIHDYVNKLYSKKNLDLTKPVLITTWQSIQRRQKDFFDRFECVLVDEAHGGKALQLKNILIKCANSEYRIGFTGTLPTEQSDIYTIFGFLGPKIFDLKAKSLIDKGILADIKIGNLLLQYPESLIMENKRAKSYQYEVDLTLEYENRNSSLDYILKRTSKEWNSLILVSRIDKHLKPLTAYLEKKYPFRKIFVIHGGVKTEDREMIRKLVDSDKGIILISTYQTMGMGINIKNLHQVIFFSSYKSKIKVLQAVGRGLRKGSRKTKMILWDIVDDLRYTKRDGTKGENYLWIHFKERCKYYSDQGFPYSNLKFKI